MKRLHLGFLVALMILALTGISFAQRGQQGGDMTPGRGYHQGGKMGKHHGYHHDHFFMMIDRLNLTEPQKRQLAGIMKEHQGEARAVVNDMLEAKKNLVEAMMNPDSSPDAVGAAFDQFAQRKRQLILIKFDVMSRLAGILTPEQQDTLQTMKENKLTMLDKMFTYRMDRIDRWIDRYTQ